MGFVIDEVARGSPHSLVISLFCAQFHIHEHIIGTPDAYGLKYVGDAIGCTPEEVKSVRQHLCANLP